MKIIKRCLFLVLAALSLSSCAKDIVDLSGDIQGVVKDYNYGQVISNCQVSLQPSGKMTFTDNAGMYEFLDIEPGDYTLVFSKAGYEDQSIKVSVISGQTSEASILLKAKTPFSLSANMLDFGDLESLKSITMFNNTDSDCAYTVSNIAPWMSFNTTQGTLPAGGTGSAIVTIDKDALNYGEYTHIVLFNYAGKGSGVINLTVKVKKVKLGVPTVTCAPEAENITQTSFEIGATLEATGGQAVTNHGHCWSTKPNPSISDNRTNMGAITTVGDFKSSITGLTTFTTYYVRAYAENAMGISYSDQVVVTTEDVASDKWDGSKAKKFADGSGTSSDPYVIMTGAQLNLMRDHADENFVLGGNINLDNNNWKPFDFSGTLDGKGYTISNLRIDRSDENQGLFAILKGTTVKNLTIKGVKIDAPSIDYIGAIAGQCIWYTSLITNCKVVFTADSYIKGKDYVGGVVGFADSSDSVDIYDCSVEGQAANVAISGNDYVGGVVGKLRGRFNLEGNCVLANISGARQIGGICGYSYDEYYPHESCIEENSFTGILSADSNVGGIVGFCSYETSVQACKSKAEIHVETGYAGGIVGCLDTNSSIIACYSDGTIVPASKATEYMGGLAGAASYDIRLYHSYSTVTCTSDNFDGIRQNSANRGDVRDCCTVANTSVSGTNNASYCTDITTFMKECYSEYEELWNYKNTWTWKGTVNGKNVNVSCPRLAWEE